MEIVSTVCFVLHFTLWYVRSSSQETRVCVRIKRTLNKTHNYVLQTMTLCNEMSNGHNSNDNKYLIGIRPIRKLTGNTDI